MSVVSVAWKSMQIGTMTEPYCPRIEIACNETLLQHLGPKGSLNVRKSVDLRKVYLNFPSMVRRQAVENVRPSILKGLERLYSRGELHVEGLDPNRRGSSLVLTAENIKDRATISQTGLLICRSFQDSSDGCSNGIGISSGFDRHLSDLNRSRVAHSKQGLIEDVNVFDGSLLKDVFAAYGIVWNPKFDIFELQSQNGTDVQTVCTYTDGQATLVSVQQHHDFELAEIGFVLSKGFHVQPVYQAGNVVGPQSDLELDNHNRRHYMGNLHLFGVPGMLREHNNGGKKNAQPREPVAEVIVERQIVV